MERVVPVHVEVAARWAESRTTLVAHRIALVARLGEGGVEVDGVPQRDPVQDEDRATRPQATLCAFVLVPMRT